MKVRASVSPAWGRHFEYFVAPTVEGRNVTFENGFKLAVASDGSVALEWPDGQMKVRACEVPEVTFADGTRADWTFKGISVEANCAIIEYMASGGRVLRWNFKVGHLNLDGRKYSGFADAVAIAGEARRVRFRGEILPGAPICLRRRSVAAGYSTMNLADGRMADAGMWKPFADGQPFTSVVGTNGVYAGMPTGVDDLTIGLSRPAGTAGVLETREIAFAAGEGETQFWWRWYAPGVENGNNDYIAWWQYVRQFLRRRYGFREWPPAPGAKMTVDTGVTSYARLGECRRTQDAGSRIVSPGMNPLVLDGATPDASFARENPFALVGSAPETLAGADALTAAAYGCFPRTGAALPTKTAAKFDDARRLCVAPFIRETAFGTTWTGKDGGLIVFLRDAEEVDVTLPKTWKIRGVDGCSLRNVKAGTLHVVESHEFDR